MPNIAPEPASPGPSYPAEAIRPRPTIDPRRTGFADFIDSKPRPPSDGRSQSARAHESNQSHRSDRESEPARLRRQSATEGGSRSKPPDDKEPTSPDPAHAQESRPADDQSVESDRDLGEPGGTPEDNATPPNEGAGTRQSSADPIHVPRRDPLAGTLLAEPGLAQTVTAAADPEDPDGPQVTITPVGGPERRAGPAITPASAGKEPAAMAAVAGGRAIPLAVPLTVPSKEKASGTLLTAEQASGEEGRLAQPQEALPEAEATPPRLPQGATPLGTTRNTAAQGDSLPHAPTAETLPQQNRASGLAPSEPTPPESALVRNEIPAVPAASTVTPDARGANATASAASGPTTPYTAVPLAKLGVEIASHAQAGRQRFDIRLDPPELGHVHVRLDVDRDGHVTSRLVVDRAETLDLLRRDAPQLERALQDAGLKTDSQTLQFTLRDQGSGQQNARQDPSGRSEPTPGTAEREAQAEDASANYNRNLGRLGGLDIRV